MTAGDARKPAFEITDDAFLGGALSLLQPRLGYRAGIDAVLLAAAIDLPPGEAAHILDIGAGVGTVGLCTARRLPATQIVLLEPELEYAALARENVRRNALDDRVRVAEAHVGAPEVDILAAGLAADSFDFVLANPPFHERDRGTRSSAALKDAAHAMDGGDLDGWARFMARMVSPRGTALLIHRSDALAEILAALRGRFGAIYVLPVHARSDAPAIRVIVRAVKGSRAPLTIAPGLVLHGSDGAFLPDIDAILRRGAGLVM